jgi:hypothetical protein
MEATPTQMRSHATRKNLSRSELDREPTSCTLDSSRSLPFIPPLSFRWSLVALPLKISPISFHFMPLHNFSPLNEGEYTHPLILFRLAIGQQRLFSLTPVFATDPKHASITAFLATLPKTQVLKVLCLPHIQKMAGVGGRHARSSYLMLGDERSRAENSG